MARRVGEGQRGNHGWLVNRPTTVLLIPVAAVTPSRDLERWRGLRRFAGDAGHDRAGDVPELSSSACCSSVKPGPVGSSAIALPAVCPLWRIPLSAAAGSKHVC